MYTCSSTYARVSAARSRRAFQSESVTDSFPDSAQRIAYAPSALSLGYIVHHCSYVSWISAHELTRPDRIDARNPSTFVSGTSCPPMFTHARDEARGDPGDEPPEAMRAIWPAK